MRRTKRLDYRAFHTQKKTINTMDNKSATPSDREEIVNQLEIGISINKEDIIDFIDEIFYDSMDPGEVVTRLETMRTELRTLHHKLRH